MKINLGFNNKRYSRDMSYDNNTTFGFGEVQPLMSQFMLPDSDIKISAKQLIRLAPLKVPSFARVHLETVCRFVPCADVYAPFENFLSNMPFTYSPSQGKVSSFIPRKLPSIPSNLLLLALLPYCKWSAFTGAKYTIQTTTDASLAPNFSQLISLKLVGFDVSETFALKTSNYLMDGVAPSFADYVVYLPAADTVAGKSFCVSLRLTAQGERLRKVFVGLGYDILTDNYQNNTDRLYVSLLPLFAFYKAYFETYYPQRHISFTDTSCFALIDHLTHIVDPVYNEKNRFLRIADLFKDFINLELSQCWYAAPDDYISIHSSNPLHTDGSGGNDISLLSNSSIDLSTTQNSEPYSGFLPSSTSPIDNVLLKSIRIFTNYVSKDSVIGQRMSDWVRQHFNADIANSLFESSNFVGRSSMPLQISDVFSTSDTASPDGVGENLGAYAGKGIGYGGLDFKFHSKVHGYLFVFACIVPESRTFQGVDPTLLATSRYELPTPEFDALGYEITDRRVFVPSNDVSLKDTNLPFYSNSGFGFVPRYTSFKYKKNICNGDMSRRSTADTMRPYFLDRIFNVNYFDGTSNVPKRTTFVGAASPDWRFITRWSYLSNFNRLFYADDNLSSLTAVDDDDVTDNFLGQMLFNVSLTDALKPLKSSYDTVASEDNDVKSIQTE